MKGKALVPALIVLLLFGAFSMAGADTILFPVIAANQPNVTTIVSVVNNHGTTGGFLIITAAADPAFLTYTYRYKDTFVGGGAPNYTGGCTTYPFTRPTHNGDVVSFDVSGTFSSGNALFSDPDSYGGGFGIPVSGAKRAYLLVTHSDAGGARVTAGGLAGQAILMDISAGAAWGYKAIDDSDRDDYNFTVDGTKSALAVESTSLFSTNTDSRVFSFFPTNEWSTRFFVTPIGNNMNNTDLTGEVSIASGFGVFFAPIGGVRDRGGNVHGASVAQSIVCTGAVDVNALLDATAQASVATTGGWGYLYNSSTVNAEVVDFLEFVVNNPTYGGTNNNGYCLSCTPYP